MQGRGFLGRAGIREYNCIYKVVLVCYQPNAIPVMGGNVDVRKSLECQRCVVVQCVISYLSTRMFLPIIANE